MEQQTKFVSIILAVLVLYLLYSILYRYKHNETYISTGTLHDGLTTLDESDNKEVVLSHRSKDLWLRSQNRYLNRMITGEPIPQELLNRINSECSAGHQCQYMNNDRYYYFDHDRKGWIFGTKSQDIGHCHTSAKIRTYGNSQKCECSDFTGPGFDKLYASKFVNRRRANHNFARVSDLDQLDARI